MDKLKYLSKEIEKCNQFSYDEEVVPITQQEVDNLLEKRDSLSINKIKIDNEITLLAVGSLNSINKFPFIKR